MPPPLGFREVRDIFAQRDPNAFGHMGQVDFSRYAQNASGNPEMFGAADSYGDLVFKSVPDAIDRGMEKYASPLLDASGELFEGVASSLGASQGVGTEVGRQLPAGMVDFSPLLAGAAGGAVFGPAGAAVGGAVGLGLTALMTGMRAFKDTDSIAQAAITGGVSAALPFASKAGGAVAGRAIAKQAPLIAASSGAAAKTATAIGGQLGKGGARLGEYAGGQAAALATEFAGDAAGEVVGGGDLSNVFSKDFLIASAISELPFAVYDIGRGFEPSHFEKRLKAKANKITDDTKLLMHETTSAEVAQERQSKKEKEGKIDDMPVDEPTIFAGSTNDVEGNAPIVPDVHNNAAFLLEAQKRLREAIDQSLNSRKGLNTSEANMTRLDELFKRVHEDMGKIAGLHATRDDATIAGLSHDTLNSAYEAILMRHGMEEAYGRILGDADTVYKEAYDRATENGRSPYFETDIEVQKLYDRGGGTETLPPSFLVGQAIPETWSQFNMQIMNNSADGGLNVNPMTKENATKLLHEPKPGDSIIDYIMDYAEMNRELKSLGKLPINDRDIFEAWRHDKKHYGGQGGNTQDTKETRQNADRAHTQREVDSKKKIVDSEAAARAAAKKAWDDQQTAAQQAAQARGEEVPKAEPFDESGEGNNSDFAPDDDIPFGENEPEYWQENEDDGGDFNDTDRSDTLESADEFSKNMDAQYEKAKELAELIRKKKLSIEDANKQLDTYGQSFLKEELDNPEGGNSTLDDITDEAYVGTERGKPQRRGGNLGSTLHNIAGQEGLDIAGYKLLQKSVLNVLNFIPGRNIGVGFLEQLKDGTQTNHLGLAETTIAGVRNVYLGALHDVKGMSAKAIASTHAFIFGHELAHMVQHQAKRDQLKGKLGRDYKEWVNYTDQADPELVDDLVTVLKEMLPKELQGNKYIDELLTARSGDELRANIHSVFAMAQASKNADMGYGMRFLPEPARKMFTSLLTQMKRVSRSIKRVFGENKALDNVGQDRIDKMSKLFEDLQTDAMKTEQDIAEFSQITDLTPQRIMDMNTPVKGEGDVVDMMNFAAASLKPKLDKNGIPEPINKTWLQKRFDDLSWAAEKPQQMVERNPVMRPLYNAYATHSGDVKKALTRIMQWPLGMPDSGGVLGSNPQAIIYKRVQKSDKMRRMTSQLMLRQTTMENAAPDVDTLRKELDSSLHHKEDANWKKLTDQEKTDVTSNLFQHMEGAKENINMVMKTDLGVGVQTLAMLGNTKLPKVSRKEMIQLSENLINASDIKQKAIESGDMAKLAEAQKMLDDQFLHYAEKGEQQNYAPLANLAEQIARTQGKYREHLKKSPVQFSTLKHGRFKLSYTDMVTGQHGSVAAETQADIAKIKEDLTKRNKGDFQEFDSKNRAGGKFTIDPTKDALFKQLDEERAQVIRDMKLEEADEAVLLEMLATTQEFRSMAKTSKADEGFYARLDKIESGEEYLDMMSAFAADAQMTARASENRLMEARVRYAKSDPALKQFPAERDQILQNLENYKHPDTETGAAIVKGIFTYMIGLNIPTHMLELTQPAFSVLPQMIAEGNGTIQSGKDLINAGMEVTGLNKLMIGKYLSGKGKSDFDDIELWATGRETKPDGSKRKVGEGIKNGEEISLVLQELAKDNLVSLGPQHEVADQKYLGNLDAQFTARHGRGMTVAERLKSPINAYHNLSAAIYGAFTHTNARISGIVGVRMMKRRHPGMKPIIDGKLNPEFYEKVRDFTKTTTYSGGPTDRTTLAYSS